MIRSKRLLRSAAAPARHEFENLLFRLGQFGKFDQIRIENLVHQRALSEPPEDARAPMPGHGHFRATNHHGVRSGVRTFRSFGEFHFPFEAAEEAAGGDR